MMAGACFVSWGRAGIAPTVGLRASSSRNNQRRFMVIGSDHDTASQVRWFQRLFVGDLRLLQIVGVDELPQALRVRVRPELFEDDRVPEAAQLEVGAVLVG